jgi:hypothetical protein
MRQIKRLCLAHGEAECGITCPLSGDGFACSVAIDVPNDIEEKRLVEIERIVMDWAAANPEPRYPTWREWHKANFPNVECGKLCPAMFGGNPEGGCINATCEGCLDRPIPADVAEKLGIKPIGGREG